MWPAVAGIVGFAWLELVYIYPDKDRPSTLAALSLAYFLIMLLGMGLFGVEEWGDRPTASAPTSTCSRACRRCSGPRMEPSRCAAR